MNRTNVVDEVQRVLSQVDALSEDQMHNIKNGDSEFMLALFRNHPNARSKLFGIKHIAIGYYPAKNVSKCFYIIKSVSRNIYM